MVSPGERPASESLPFFTVAICTFNGGERLEPLIVAIREQIGTVTGVEVEILVVDNNSTDTTCEVVRRIQSSAGSGVRLVHERRQGIVHTRNRAVAEAPGPYLAFLDDDELPAAGWLATALDALRREGADCVGGRIEVAYPRQGCPRWMVPEVEAFLGRVDHGPVPVWITDRSMAIYSGNVAYNAGALGDALRFDPRYNRVGSGIGGGEDTMLFWYLLEQGARLRYRPEMVVRHHIEPRKLRRCYFLYLHFLAGIRHGEHQLPDYPRQLVGVPPFMWTQVLKQLVRTLGMVLRMDRYSLRQGMNLTHAVGSVVGRVHRWRRR